MKVCQDFQHFSYDLYKIPYRGYHKTVLCEWDFRENWRSESHGYSRA